MIVLSRKQGESILIGDVIELSVVEIRGDKVRIGVIAPRNCSIHRGEVWSALAHAGAPAPPSPEELLGPGKQPASPMLVLSRKKNESIVIHGDITITVVEIRDDKIRLGIQAPKHVPICRREVYDALKRSQEKP